MSDELTVRRVPGGIEILDAPRSAVISLQVLAEACGHEVRVNGDQIVVADQVVYQVTAWQASPPGLRCALMEDRRPRGEGER
ncbi:hypothetical protein KVH22_30000 [Streptomyces olivaceus]|uniref:hypothetical protein n=1 Tax=Streptomyces olivaceus TaxID=47716 RepID=UPI001CCBA3AB|nr:hypothetical protein [Streptomyces olivaceus]MBZ6259753.1 hypothetical protein [Streptomyces olivaceus]